MFVDLAKPFDLQLAPTIGLNPDNSSPFLAFYLAPLFLTLRQTTRERGFYPDKEESKILRAII